MKKIVTILFVLLSITPSLVAQTTLSAGQLVIVGFNMDDPDQFSFVPLVDLASGTVIKFTDNGWIATTSSFRTGEGTITYTAPSAVTAGTVITFSSPAAAPFSSAGSFAFSATGDQILAYQGSDSSPTFIFAVNNDGAAVWQTDATSANNSALPSGLTNGTNAVALSELDNYLYTGPTGNPTQLLASVSNSANWTGSDTTPFTMPTSSPLPIELADFTAQATKDAVTLNWQTISEVNSDVFEVQHLVKGEWQTVATVQAAGSSTDVRSYTQAVQGLQVGTHYFRLKSVDKDGGVKYSKQVAVSVEVPGTFVMNPAYPNPFNPQTTLTFAVAQKQAVTMTLFNALGQQISVLYQGTPEANTLQTVQLDGSALQSGAYFVRLAGTNFNTMQKVMLVK
ncbi:MAG: T9SS type A sorting domain-containing protein [Bacteroidetes Order II. Incertae sedis bacterium]|nr:T9SS type A sorting domain-containing protein [Bacteroidetes Order II. bacterium]